MKGSRHNTSLLHGFMHFARAERLQPEHKHSTAREVWKYRDWIEVQSVGLPAPWHETVKERAAKTTTRKHSMISHAEPLTV